MAISYKKLFKLMIDRDIKKNELCKLADISTSTVTKLVKGDNVNTDIIDRICKALNCRIEDIMEYRGDNHEQQSNE